MKSYIVESTFQTPAINFDLTKGILEIKGRSIPENSIEFYKPLFEALQEYLVSFQRSTKVLIFLEYFSTSSSRCLLDILGKLEKLHHEGGNVEVTWCYEAGDNDMLEAGQDYQTISNLPFVMVEVPEVI